MGAAAPSEPDGLSIIIPVLDEAGGIRTFLEDLLPLREAGAEIIVVDGDSEDATAEIATGHADRVLSSRPGRARQMNAGAAVARGQNLLFLHADTRLPPRADALVREALERRPWGRFDVRLSGGHPLLRMVETLISLRSRIVGVATGDQAIFVRRSAFDAIGGYPEIPLMEDIALTRALLEVSRPACLRARVVSSSRRWERDGIWRTIFLMWRLRWAFWRGADPRDLHRHYYGRPPA